MVGLSSYLIPESHYGSTEYETRSPNEIGSYKPYLDSFIQLVLQNSQTDNPLVADVAAGSGVTSEELRKSGLNVTAIDASPHALFATQANKVHTSFAEWIISTGLSTVDGVHSKDYVGVDIAPEFFLDQCAMVLKPGGIVMCTNGASDRSFLLAVKNSQSYTLLSREIWTPKKGELDWNDGIRRFVYTMQKSR